MAIDRFEYTNGVDTSTHNSLTFLKSPRISSQVEASKQAHYLSNLASSQTLLKCIRLETLLSLYFPLSTYTISYCIRFSVAIRTKILRLRTCSVFLPVPK
jgi:hypothetical protein